MDYYQLVARHFQHSMEAISLSVDTLAEPLYRASVLLTDSFLHDRKLISCGSGPGIVAAQLMVTYLTSQYHRERPALPAMSLCCDNTTLSAISCDSSNEEIYSRQIRSLGLPGDVLLVVDEPRNRPPLIRAIEAAHERNLRVILLSSSTDPAVDATLHQDDIHLAVNSSNASQRLELQIMTVGCLCELIDQGLFGDFDGE